MQLDLERSHYGETCLVSAWVDAKHALTLGSCDGFQGLRNPTPVSQNDKDSLENFTNYFCNLESNSLKFHKQLRQRDTSLRNKPRLSLASKIK